MSLNFAAEHNANTAVVQDMSAEVLDCSESGVLSFTMYWPLSQVSVTPSPMCTVNAGLHGHQQLVSADCFQQQIHLLTLCIGTSSHVLAMHFIICELPFLFLIFSLGCLFLTDI